MVCSNVLQELELAQMCPAGGSWIMKLAWTVNSQILVTSSDEVTQDESQVEGWWALLWFGDDCLCDGTSVGGRKTGPFLRSALLVGCHGQSDRYLNLVSLRFFKCKRWIGSTCPGCCELAAVYAKEVYIVCICGKLLEGTGTIVTCKCQIRCMAREILGYLS